MEEDIGFAIVVTALFTFMLSVLFCYVFMTLSYKGDCQARGEAMDVPYHYNETIKECFIKPPRWSHYIPYETYITSIENRPSKNGDDVQAPAMPPPPMATPPAR